VSHGTVGWFAAVCPWVLAALMVFYLLHWLNPLLGWVWTVAVLYTCIALRDLVQALKDIFDALRVGDLERARSLLLQWRGEPAGAYGEGEIAKAAIETALLRAHREVFAVIFWFILLPGPAGALLYRRAAEMEQRWGRRRDDEFRLRAFLRPRVSPARLAAGAVVGDRLRHRRELRGSDRGLAQLRTVLD
jgi:adenosylcobinamide-phosphate synthase